MGRTVRRVPANWDHPKTKRYGDGIGCQPMYDRHIDDAMAEWLSAFDERRAGQWSDFERECYGDEPNMLAAWLADDGLPPDPTYHRPWRDDEATWFQVWETVSEGTPVTPPFATREELIDHLVAHGDDWDQHRGHGGWKRPQAEAFVNAGWAPSMIVVNTPGQPVAIHEPRDGMPPP